MATRWDIIRQELDDNPLGRNYGVSDKSDADDLNTSYRDGAADGNALVQYTLVEVHRVNTGIDLERLTIYSRITDMANARAGDDVYGQAPPNNATRTSVSAAMTFKRLLSTDAQTVLTNLNDARYAQLLDALAAADVMDQTQADDMKAFSQGQRTRAEELQVGRVSEGDVASARALP